MHLKTSKQQSLPAFRVLLPWVHSLLLRQPHAPVALCRPNSKYSVGGKQGKPRQPYWRPWQLWKEDGWVHQFPDGPSASSSHIVIVESHNQCIQFYPAKANSSSTSGSEGTHLSSFSAHRCGSGHQWRHFCGKQYHWVSILFPEGKFKTKIRVQSLLGSKGVNLDLDGHIVVDKTTCLHFLAQWQAGWPSWGIWGHGWLGLILWLWMTRMRL